MHRAIFLLIAAALTLAGRAEIDTPSEALSTERGAGVVVGPLESGEIREFEVSLKQLGISLEQLVSIESTCRCLEVLTYPTLETPALRGRYLGVNQGAMDQTLTLITKVAANSRRVEFYGKIKPGASDFTPADWNQIAPEVFAQHAASHLKGIERIGFDQAKALLKSGETTLIDLRRPEEFFAEHISGAINLKPHKLANSALVRRQRSIILTGEPFLTNNTLRTIKQLRGRGVTECYFLPGGTQQWARRGGQIEGERKNRGQAIPELSPAELYAAGGGNGLVAIKLGGGDVGFNERYLMPGATWFHLKSGEKQEVPGLEEHLKTHPEAAVVLIPSEGADPEFATGLIAAFTTADAWLLSGGMAHYASFLKDMSVAVRASRDREQRVSTSGGVVYHTSGCSACPGRSRD